MKILHNITIAITTKLTTTLHPFYHHGTLDDPTPHNTLKPSQSPNNCQRQLPILPPLLKPLRKPDNTPPPVWTHHHSTTTQNVQYNDNNNSAEHYDSEHDNYHENNTTAHDEINNEIYNNDTNNNNSILPTYARPNRNTKTKQRRQRMTSITSHKRDRTFVNKLVFVI